MLDDDPNEEAQRQFRAQVDEDVANWISQLDSDIGTGVPPPPQIKVTEVSSQPYEFDLLQPGSQNASTAPAQGPHTDPTPTGACCSGSDCTIEGQGQCESHGGTYQGDDTICDPNPCIECTDCTPLVIGPPCTEGGNYWTIQNCDGSCSGEMFTDPLTSFMRHVTYCTTVGEGCSIQSTNCTTTRNLATCEDTLVGPCDGSCPDGQTIIDEVSIVYAQCQGACCLLGVCSIQTLQGCTDLGGTYQGDNTVCDPNPC